MTNKQKLTEQQLQEELLDEISDFSKAITKKIGQGFGAVQGAGQKIKGATKRGIDALGKSFQQGKQQTQKAVAGQDYKAPQQKAQTPAQTQTQAQPQGQTKTKQTGVLGNLAKNLGDVALNTAAGTGYDYRTGVTSNPTTQVSTDKQGTQGTKTQTGTQTQTTTKRAKTGGRVAGQVSGTDSAKYQRQRRADIKAKKNAVKTGIDTAQTQGGPKKTNVPGKPPTKTAQNISKKTGVNTARIGKDKLDLNDPKMANIAAQINKQLGADTTDSISKLQPADKAKLKKAIS